MEENMEFKEDFFINPDGIKLYRQIYQPTFLPIKSLVFVCHGLFEHCQSEYYSTIINPLRKIGCVVLTHDHYGHGHSEGARGMISNLDILIRDVILDLEETIKNLQLPDHIPVFLYGHSMGGLMSVLISLKKKDYFKGIILEAPALCIKVNKASLSLIKFLNFIYPSCPLRKSPYSNICRDEKQVERIINDPFHIHAMLSAMTALSIAKSIKQCKKLWNNFDTSVLIGHGDADLLTIASGSKRFIDAISSTDKTLIIYTGARHRLRTEIDNVNVEFIENVVSWVKARID